MKFKVFDKEKKEFVEPPFIGSFVLLTTGQLATWSYSGGWDENQKRFIPIFSTDQKDIEGTEIYEGDACFTIRKDDCYPGDKIIKETVVIKKPEYEELGDKMSGGPDGSYPLISIKIIGSIYTNPELMEKG